MTFVAFCQSIKFMRFVSLLGLSLMTFVPYRVCWLWDLSHYDVCHLFMKFVDKRVCRSIKILVRFKKKEKNCPNRGLEIWRVLHYQNRIITNGHQLHISTFYIVFRSSKGLNKTVQHCGYAVKATFCYFWIILCACMPPFLSKQWWAWCRGGPRGGWTGGRTSCGGGRRRSPACPGTWRGSTTRSRPGPPRPCSCKYRTIGGPTSLADQNSEISPAMSPVICSFIIIEMWICSKDDCDNGYDRNETYAHWAHTYTHANEEIEVRLWLMCGSFLTCFFTGTSGLVWVLVLC